MSFMKDVLLSCPSMNKPLARIRRCASSPPSPTARTARSAREETPVSPRDSGHRHEGARTGTTSWSHIQPNCITTTPSTPRYHLYSRQLHPCLISGIVGDGAKRSNASTPAYWFGSYSPVQWLLAHTRQQLLPPVHHRHHQCYNLTMAAMAVYTPSSATPGLLAAMEAAIAILPSYNESTSSVVGTSVASRK